MEDNKENFKTTIDNPSVTGKEKDKLLAALNNPQIAQGTSFGDSRKKEDYDSLPTYFTNVEEQRAERQGLGEKYGRGLMRMAGTAGTSFLEGTIGAAIGVTNALATGETSGLYDHTFGHALDAVNESLAEAAPIYYSEEQKNSILNANFIPDKLFNGAGYMLGAIAAARVGGRVLGSLGKLAMVGKSIKGVLSSEAAISGLLSSANATRLANGMQDLFLGALSAHGESSAEARGARKETFNNLVEKYRKNNGKEPEGEDLEQLNRLADAAGNVDYSINLAVTGGTNMLQFGRLMSMGFKTNEKAFNKIIRDVATGKYSAEQLGELGNLVRKTAPFTSGLLNEGGQEGVQYGTEIGVNDYYTRKYDSDSWNTIGEIAKTTLDSFANTFSSKEGIESMLLGAILGAGGGLLHNDVKQKELNTNRVLGLLNDNNLSSIANKLSYAAQINSYEKDKAVALQNKDIFAYKNLEYDQFKTYVKSRVDADQFSSLIDELNEQKQLTDEQFKEKFGFPANEELPKSKLDIIEELKSKATKVKDIQEAIETKFPFNNTNGILSNDEFSIYKTLLFHNATVLDNTNSRIKEVGNKITMLSTAKNAIPVFDSIEASTNPTYLENYLNQIDKNIEERKLTNPTSSDISNLESFKKDIVELEKRRQGYIDVYNNLQDPNTIKKLVTEAKEEAEGKKVESEVKTKVEPTKTQPEVTKTPEVKSTEEKELVSPIDLSKLPKYMADDIKKTVEATDISFRNKVIQGAIDGKTATTIAEELGLEKNGTLDTELVKKVRAYYGIPSKDSDEYKTWKEKVTPKTETTKSTTEEDKEYKDFIDSGKVSKERLNSIADKIKNGKKLTEKEQAYHAAKTKEVEGILKKFQKTETTSTKAEEVKPKEKVSTLKDGDKFTLDVDGIKLKFKVEKGKVSKVISILDSKGNIIPDKSKLNEKAVELSKSKLEELSNLSLEEVESIISGKPISKKTSTEEQPQPSEIISEDFFEDEEEQVEEEALEVGIVPDYDKVEYKPSVSQGGYTMLKTSATDKPTEPDKVRWKNYLDSNRLDLNNTLLEVIYPTHSEYDSLLNEDNKKHLEKYPEDKGVFLVLTDSKGNRIKDSSGNILYTSPVANPTNTKGYAVAPDHYSKIHKLEYNVGDENNPKSAFRQHFDSQEVTKHTAWRNKLMSGEYKYIKPVEQSPGVLLFTDTDISPLEAFDLESSDVEFVIPTTPSEPNSKYSNHTYRPKGASTNIQKKLVLGSLYAKIGDTFIRLKSRALGNSKDFDIVKKLFSNLSKKEEVGNITAVLKNYVQLTSPTKNRNKHTLFFDGENIQYGEEGTVNPTDVSKDEEFLNFLYSRRRQADKDKLKDNPLVPTVDKNGFINYKKESLIPYTQFLFGGEQPAFTVNIPPRTQRQHENSYLQFDNSDNNLIKDVLREEENSIVSEDKTQEVEINLPAEEKESTDEKSDKIEPEIKPEEKILPPPPKDFGDWGGGSFDRLFIKGNYKLEDLKKAEEWYKKTFGDNNFKITKELIDNKAFGQFYNGIVYLWEKAEEGTLFHEAFHKVINEFLTEEQENNLYEELRKFKGKATLRSGEKVLFSKLTNEQAQEYLAEDFRNYMLNGQKAIAGQPVRNTIFRRLYNYIKKFFTGNVSIEDVYKKLATEGYSKDKQVRVSFGRFNRPIPFLGMKSKEKKELMDFTTNLFFGKLLQHGITPNNLINEDTVANANKAYGSVFKTLKEQYNKLVPKITDKSYTEEEAKEYTNLHNILSNFDKLVSEHIEHMRPLIKLPKSDEEQEVEIKKSEDVAEDNEDITQGASANEEDSPTPEESEGGNPSYAPADETNPITMLSNNTKILLATLRNMDKIVDENGNTSYVPSKNQYGEYVAKEGFSKIYLTLSSKLEGALTLDGVWNKLNELQEDYPYVNDLINKLGHPDYIANATPAKAKLWSDFMQDMRKYGSTGTQTIVDPENGRIYQVDANSEGLKKRLKDRWKTNLLKKQEVKEIDGQLVVTEDRLEEIKKLTGTKFLNNLGIEIENYDENTSEPDLVNRVNAQIDGIRLSLSSISTLSDLFSDFSEGDALGGRLNNLLDIAIEQSTEVAEGSYFTSDNKSKYMYTNHNYFTLAVSEINSVNSLKELIEKYPHYQYIEGSVRLDNIFPKKNENDKVRLKAIDKSTGKPIKINVNTYAGMNITEELGKATTKLHAADKVVEEVNNLLLYGQIAFLRTSDKSTEKSAVIPNYTTSSKKLSKVPVPLEELSSSFDSKELRTIFVDKYFQAELNTIRNIRLDNIGRDVEVYGTNPEVKLKKGDSERIQKFFEDNKEIAELFQNNKERFKAFEEDLEGLPITKETAKVWLTNSPVAANWVVFQDILSDSTKEALEPYMNSRENVTPALLNKVYKDVQNYFNEVTFGSNPESITSIFNEYQIGKKIAAKTEPIYVDGKKTSEVRTLVAEQYAGLSNRLTEKYDVNTIKRGFAVNQLINAIEDHKIFYGEKALYKDPFKRYSAYSGEKKYAIAEKPFLDNINNRRKWGEYKVQDTVNTMTVADVMAESKAMDTFVAALEGIYSKEKVYEIYGEYMKMTEADAQGLGNLIFYKQFKELVSAWTQEEEDQYNYEMAYQVVKLHDKGIKKVSEELYKEAKDLVNQGNPGHVLVAIKPQYAGPQVKEGMFAHTFHKYSIAPMFYRLVEDTNLEEKYLNMIDNKVGYMTFSSGNKVGALVNSEGKMPTFYDEEGKPRLIDETTPIQKLYYRYLGIQVDIAPKAKKKVIFGTQFRKLFMANSFNGGVPFDYKGTEEEWNSIPNTEEGEQLKKSLSPTYAIHKEFLGIIDSMVQDNWDRLVKELGFEEDKVTGQFKQLDVTKLVKLLKQESIDRQLAKNLIDSLEWEQVNGDKVLKYSIDSLVNRSKLESMMFSLVNSRVIKQTMPGDGMVQRANTGFENKQNRVAKDNGKYLSNTLKFYRRSVEQTKDFSKIEEGQIVFFDNWKELSEADIRILHRKAGELLASGGEILIPFEEKGMPDILKEAIQNLVYLRKTKDMQVRVPLTAQFGELIRMIKGYENMSSEEITKAVNKLIKEESFDKRVLTMIGYRIPTQGLNSIEFMEIVEFLPDAAGNTIELPTEIVAKSGGDFDIDKLNIFRANFKVEGRDMSEVDYVNRAIESSNKNAETKYTTLTEKELEELRDKEDKEDKFLSLVQSSIKGYKKYKLQDPYVNYKSYSSRTKSESQSINNFSEATLAEKQNRIIELAKSMLEMNANFEQLTTPNTVDTLKGLVSEIRGARGIKTPKKSFTRELTFGYILDQFKYFLGGKAGVGVAAVHNTFHTLFQEANTKIDKIKVEVNFEVNKDAKGNILLGSGRDVTRLDEEGKETKGRLISDIISQFINAYVDVARDPFYKDLNAGLDAANVYFFLIHAGADIRTISYFMNQPIIIELLNEEAANNSILANLTGKKKKDDIAEEILDKYSKKISSNYKRSTLVLGTELNGTLKKYMGGDTSNEFYAAQVQFLNDFLRYREYANDLTEFTRTLNFDTAKIGSFAQGDRVLESIEKIERNESIFSPEERNKVKDLTIVGSFDKLKKTQAMYSPLFITQEESFRQTRTKLMKIVNPFKSTDKDKLYKMIDNDFINYITQRFYNDKISKLGKRVSELSKGSKSVANRLVDIKKIVKDNLLIDNLQSLVAKTTSDPSNITSYAKRLTASEQNDLTEAFRELLEYDGEHSQVVQEFANDLVKFGIVQSGLHNSPITYLGLIPYDCYGDVVKQAISNYEKEVTERGTPIETIHEDFIARFFLKNVGNPVVARYAKKKKDGNISGNVVWNKDNDAKKPQLTIRTTYGIKNHYQISGLENIVLNLNGYKLQDFYLDKQNAYISIPFGDSESGNDDDGNTSPNSPNTTPENGRENEVKTQNPQLVQLVKFQLDKNKSPEQIVESLRGKVNAEELSSILAELSPKMEDKNGIVNEDKSQEINFQEDPSFGYRERTMRNASADATIALATDFNSAGEKLTKNSVLNQKKQYIPINAASLEVTEDRVNKIVDMLNQVNAKTLNIAGNGIYTMKASGYTQQMVDDFTYNLLNAVLNSPRLNTKIESIRSGGQTGFDEAGAKAGIKLGLPTLVLAPKGWKFRDITGKDISDEAQFKARFEVKTNSAESKLVSDKEVEDLRKQCEE